MFACSGDVVRRLFFLLFLLVIALWPLTAQSPDVNAPAMTVTAQNVETTAGLHIATFSTLQGTVTVNLPDDMAAGDTIAGTVVADGAGSTPEEKKRNQDSLSGTVVEMEAQKTAASDPGGRGKWIVPTAAVMSIPLILRDHQGRPIGKVAIPVAKAPTGEAASGFKVPSIGQSGRPVSISGAFDGNFATSDVSVAGKPLVVLAESPRKLIARAPVDVVGLAAIEMTKGSLVTRCQYRNLDVKLSAPKLTLKSGERTTMTVTVDGAAGLEQSVPLSVVNRSPTVVHVDSGDVQTIQIDSRQLTGGTFVATRGLTGVRPGGFNIQASVLPDGSPAARCTTVADNSPKRMVPGVADVAPDPRRPAPADVYHPPLTPAYADDPEGLRTAAVAVHTGTRWRWLHGGNTVNVYRDNPPMTGVTDLAANSVGYDVRANDLPPFWRTNANLTLWRDADLFFAGSGGHTFTDAENDGLLGVAPAGLLPREGTAARVRWHTGGLQLDPGAPLELWLRRRGPGGTVSAVGDANGFITLDPGTIIVGVAVAVIEEEGITPPIVDRAIAELWFDGRTAGRQHAIDLLGTSVQPVLDRDPHPGWSVERLDQPNDGRRLAAMGQDPDGVWSYCGENFGRNIQFRLVRFGRVQAASNPDCAHAVSRGLSQALPNCIVRWGEELQRQTGDHRPAITIAIPYAYPTAGVAQAWQGGALVSQEALTGGYGRNTIAHEIGHVLGWNSGIFYDGQYPNNLMSGGAERTLLRQQCEFAYRTAAAYSTVR